MSTKSIIIAVVVIVLVILVGWYIYATYMQPKPASESQTSLNQASNDTTSSIQNDLSQVPDDSAVNSQLDSLDKDVQNF